MTLTEKYMINAYAASLAGKPCTVPHAGVEPMELYELAMGQGIAPALHFALKDSDWLPEDVARRFDEAHAKSVMRDLKREEEEKRVFAAFDKADISYLPLKGSVIRSFYPSPEMRTMGDTDIMIERYARKDVGKAMKECGYRICDSHSGHDIYMHENGCVFELHWRPEDGGDFHSKLMERALPVGEKGNCLSLSVSDFYLYMISHLARHVRTTGAGVRLFADIKVFYSKQGARMDEAYIKKTLAEMGLVRFEREVKKLIHSLFYGAPADETTARFAEYVVCGGVFGSAENLAANKRGDKSAIGYFFSSVFPGYSAMKERYPFLKYLPFLLPVMWVVRWFSLLFRGKKPVSRYKKGAGVSRQTVKNNKLLLEELEIKRFKDGKLRMTAGDIALALFGVCFLIFATVYVGRSFFVADSGRAPLFITESVQLPEDSEEENSEDNRIPERSYGTVPYKDGLYTGYMYRGLPDGTGTLMFNSGESYSGSFAEGEFNGNGLYKYNDGSRYDGMWYEGEINGDGTWYFADGSFISGNFFEGEPEGVCVYECANGDIYEGTLKDGKWHGQGKFVWVNGDTYEGSFVDGIRQGEGKYQYCGGDVYEGGWINNSPNGYGTFKMSGASFTGIFVEGILEGEGTAVLANGDKYTGYFIHGAFNDDKATYTFKKGGSYVGGFENGVFHGEGTLTYKDGDKVTGTFENGKLQGKARYYYSGSGVWRTVTYKDGEPK
ncbi:MAG: nucleotidyltransferase family protein [Clostridia bacterium]|nr:nucleotidyltransferase family protein [Clostridia bacterium]